MLFTHFCKHSNYNIFFPQFCLVTKIKFLKLCHVPFLNVAGSIFSCTIIVVTRDFALTAFCQYDFYCLLYMYWLVKEIFQPNMNKYSEQVLPFPSAKVLRKGNKGLKRKKSGKKGKKKKGKKKTPPASPEKIEVFEDGIVGLLMTTKTQEIFRCIVDEHVSEEAPTKLITKEEIIEDLRMRAAISDFHPVKQLVLDYPEEELLVVYDPSFKYGQSFYLCVSVAAKQRVLAVPEEKEASKVELVEVVKEKVYVYTPPEPKEWIDLGSSAEIAEESTADTRPKIRFLVSRLRSKFEGPCYLEDRDADPWSSDTGLSTSYVSCQSYLDKNFTVMRMEQDGFTQAVPSTAERFSQTTWKHPVNASVQYEPRTMPKAEVKITEESEDYVEFLKDVLPRFELASQQNLIMDVFFDDWSDLGEEDPNIGSKMDNHLKEYQSFTDLIYSKDKTISCIDWHPQIKGTMGVACSERLTADERIEHSNLQMAASSMILIWSFADPINPQLMLESPDDIMCFKFCPTNPNYVAGGCINGQLVLWDIGAFEEKLINAKAGGVVGQPKQVPMFGEELVPDTPTARYAAVSSIEHGHKNMISQVQWVPDHFEFNRLGIPLENKNYECCQIITCSTDCTVMLWDTRPGKISVQPTTTEGGRDSLTIKLSVLPHSVPTTFSHLDLMWRPFLKLSMLKSEESGEFSPLQFAMREKQGFRDHGFGRYFLPTKPAFCIVEAANKNEDLDSKTSKTQQSSRSAKPLEAVNTQYFVGTEDGEVVCFDFKLEKDAESGKNIPPRANWYAVAHGGPVHTLERNPFFHDLILSVGGWNFSLWREEYLSAPVLLSACGEKFYSAGKWSLSRPGVFFLCTRDGNIEVWDVLDRTYEPILVQNVTTAQITDISPCIITKQQHLLAVTDNIGTLHVLEIAWSLRSPSTNEELGMKKYLERESKRIEYFESRKPLWLEYKKDKEETKIQRRKTMATRLYLAEASEEEAFEAYKTAYEDYLKLERKLLIELGIPVDDEKEEVKTDF